MTPSLWNRKSYTRWSTNGVEGLEWIEHASEIIEVEKEVKIVEESISQIEESRQNVTAPPSEIVPR